MRIAKADTTIHPMTSRTSYAVAWHDGDAPRAVGRLDLTARGVRLEGRAGRGRESRRLVGYQEIAQVALRRVSNRRVVSLDLDRGGRLVIVSLDAAGSLVELSRALSARTGKPHAGSGAAPMPAVGWSSMIPSTREEER